MTPAREADFLDQLESRIQKAVALVSELRREKDDAEKNCDMLRISLEEARIAQTAASAEIEALRAERQQVRSRLEKLLGHIDQLGAA